MWRSCAKRARGLSRWPDVHPSLSSLSTHPDRNVANHNDNVGSESKTVVRSFCVALENPKRQRHQNTRSSVRNGPRGLKHPVVNHNADSFSSEAHRQQNRKLSNVSSSHPMVTLHEASKHVAFLSSRLSELPPLPPVWCTEVTPVDSAAEREAIFREAQALLDRIENAVNSQQLNPSGKHGREISYLIGQILQLYSNAAVPFGDDTSVFDACCGAMTLLQEWNLDIQPQNYACAVEVAARESRWKEASVLFSEQIDPDAFGYAPMEISKYLAVGLYAIARNSQIQGGAVVDHVMDAVLKMSMVCPTDQDDYVLSAGLALGHAGEGEAFATYLANSYNSSRLGQPLTAAVMSACILSSQADKALEIFQELVADPLRGDSEWQYGGQYNAMNPLCRDVSMRAMGASSMNNLSDHALELYEQVKSDEFQISVDALHGVVKSCERDGRWEAAVDILIDFLNRIDDPLWLVIGDDTMAIVSIEKASKKEESLSPDIVIRRALPIIGNMVASVMRSCNSAEKYGMSLLWYHLLCDRLPPQEERFITGKEPNKLSTTIFARFGSHEELIIAAMSSLCGLDCHSDALQLYSDALEFFPEQSWYDAHDCFAYAQTSHSASVSVLPVPWKNADRHIQLLIKAFPLVKRGHLTQNADQMRTLGSAIGKAIRACTAAGQPEVGLFLAKYVDSLMTADDKLAENRPFSFGNAVTSFFGLENASRPYQVAQVDDKNVDSLLSEASVVAESISAYRAMNMPEDGLELLEHIPSTFGSDQRSNISKRGDTHWIPVINQAILLLSDLDRIGDAYELFMSTHDASRDQETFIVMATAFEKRKQWKDIVKLYFHALNCGLLSEHLAVLAMKGVVHSDSQEQAQQLRLIAKRISEISGMKESRWLASRYWQLEQSLGWNAARLLMWWRDATIANEMKLHFAIEQVEARQKAGLTPKNSSLWFIVDSIRQYNGPTEVMPFSREEWLDLLRAVLAEAEQSSLWNSPKFVESACRSLHWLDGKQDCVNFARDAVARGVRISHTTIQEVSEVARSQGLAVDDLSLLSSGIN